MGSLKAPHRFKHNDTASDSMALGSPASCSPTAYAGQRISKKQRLAPERPSFLDLLNENGNLFDSVPTTPKFQTIPPVSVPNDLSSSQPALPMGSHQSFLVPPGWEQRTIQTGRVYYIDHFNRKTQWNPPTLLQEDLPRTLPPQGHPSPALHIDSEHHHAIDDPSIDLHEHDSPDPHTESEDSVDELEFDPAYPHEQQDTTPETPRREREIIVISDTESEAESDGDFSDLPREPVWDTGMQTCLVGAVARHDPLSHQRAISTEARKPVVAALRASGLYMSGDVLPTAEQCHAQSMAVTQLDDDEELGAMHNLKAGLIKGGRSTSVEEGSFLGLLGLPVQSVAKAAKRTAPAASIASIRFRERLQPTQAITIPDSASASITTDGLQIVIESESDASASVSEQKGRVSSDSEAISLEQEDSDALESEVQPQQIVLGRLSSPKPSVRQTAARSPKRGRRAVASGREADSDSEEEREATAEVPQSSPTPRRPRLVLRSAPVTPRKRARSASSDDELSAATPRTPKTLVLSTPSTARTTRARRRLVVESQASEESEKDEEEKPMTPRTRTGQLATRRAPPSPKRPTIEPVLRVLSALTAKPKLKATAKAKAAARAPVPVRKGASRRQNETKERTSSDSDSSSDNDTSDDDPTPGNEEDGDYASPNDVVVEIPRLARAALQASNPRGPLNDPNPVVYPVDEQLIDLDWDPSMVKGLLAASPRKQREILVALFFTDAPRKKQVRKPHPTSPTKKAALSKARAS